MVNINAQKWLDEKYPKNGVCKRKTDLENKGKRRAGITLLDIRKGKVGNGIFTKNKNLVEFLKLEGFTNLRKLIISAHELIEIDVSRCPNLEELDCRSNQLNILKVNGCTNLKKIDCSNNNLKELDLSTCAKLEEVNINNCSELIMDQENSIKTTLYYDVETGKLVKASAKNSPHITKTKNNDIRNILIIGITGNGKSALANALTTSANNHFEEKNSSTSATKSFKKSDIFKWENKKYRVIDNIGFGDTDNISEEDVLFRIGEGIHSAKEGINQVLFVFKGRFAPEQVMAFNLFKDFIAESSITKFTTLVRTNFPNFRSLTKCQEDQEVLLEQSKKLQEIIVSCNGIIYVDNPSTIIESDSEDSDGEKEEKQKTASRNEKKREKSRQRLLNHLAENCLENYQLKEWNGIVAKIEEYNKKKQAIAQSNSPAKEAELKQVRSDIAKEIKERIKVSLGVEVPGLPVGLKAAVEYTKHTINW